MGFCAVITDISDSIVWNDTEQLDLGYVEVVSHSTLSLCSVILKGSIGKQTNLLENLHLPIP